MRIPTDVGVKTLLHRTRGERRAHRQFEAVKAQAEASGQMVCGVYREDGSPVYFAMPREASQKEINARAFEVKHGRKPEPGDLWLWRLAESRKAQQ